MTSPRRRQIVAELTASFAVSQRRTCRALGLHRSGVRSVGLVGDEQRALVRRIEKLAGLHPRFGYRRIWVLLRREGWSVNKKAVHRLWKLSGLKLVGPRARPRRRLPHGQDKNGCHLEPSRGKDDVWTWDFIFDRTSDGRSLKWLSLIDEYTRECLSLEARRSMTARDIQGILADVVARRGSSPLRVRSDNGPEFVAEAVRSWLETSGSGALYVAPGSPWQNGFAESFHSRLRDEFLEREEFENEVQAQALSDLWKEDYNTERPHSSLNYQTPAAFAARHKRYMPIDPIQPRESGGERNHRGLP
jgi:transposase InsO family protein